MLPEHAKFIDGVVVSPMSRTISTACLCFSPLNGEIYASPIYQSIDWAPNGLGLKKEDWEAKFGHLGTSEFAGNIRPQEHDDKEWANVWDDWTSKETGRYSLEEADKRVAFAKQALGSHCDKFEVAVVSHGSFLRKLIDSGKSPHPALPTNNKINVARLLTFLSDSEISTHPLDFMSYKVFTDGRMEKLTPLELWKARAEELRRVTDASRK